MYDKPLFLSLYIEIILKLLVCCCCQVPMSVCRQDGSSIDVNDRIHCDGHGGVVRFVGEIASTKGTYLKNISENYRLYEMYLSEEF